MPVRADYSADVDAMADAVDDATVMIVGSAPVVSPGSDRPDPRTGLHRRPTGILCHVDACLGGLHPPFLDRLGHLDKPWDFSVPGVTSISADLHKYGYPARASR